MSGSARRRSKAEELALRRSQLQRREARRAARAAATTTDGAASVQEGDSPSGWVATRSPGSPQNTPPDRVNGFALSVPDVDVPPIEAAVKAQERAARMAQAELQLERAARAESEQRAADMALRALEAEREAREAEVSRGRKPHT